MLQIQCIFKKHFHSYQTIMSIYIYHISILNIYSKFSPLNARLIHNYIRWRFIRTYIEDLSYNYVRAHRLYLANYYNNALHSSNEAYCTREVIRRFPLAIQRLYTMNLTIHSETIQTVE